MAFKDLSHLQIEYLLRWFEYHLRPEERHALMSELPAAYNAWMGDTYAVVVPRSEMPPMKKSSMAALLGEAMDDHKREMALAIDAANDANPNEYAYRMLRANAALAMATVYARLTGDRGAEAVILGAMDALQTRADRTRLAFEAPAAAAAKARS